MSAGEHSAATANESRCLGRERELAIVAQLFAAVMGDGRGRVLCVNGPAGIGKRRLVHEAARRLRAGGAAVVEGRTEDGSRAHQPVAEAIESLVRRLAEAGDTTLAGRGAELLERLEGRATRSGSASLEGGDEGPTRDGAGEERRRISLFEEVASLFAAASQRLSLVVAIHDLHRADGATRALLSHLLQTRLPAPELDTPFEAPVASQRLRALFLVTSEEDEARWLDCTAATCLTLGALDAAGIRAFLQSDEVLRIVTATTGGRPGALQALVEANPPEAGQLAEARLARLSPGARRLAAALSVFARPTAPDALRRACDESARERGSLAPSGPPMARAITELLDSALVERLVAGGELRLGFARAEEQAAAYTALDPEERSALHLAVGRALRARGDEADRAAVAAHLCRAGAGEEAVDAAIFAAERLASGFGYDRAIALYREAVRLTARDDVRSRIETRLVELLRLTGDYAGALADAERLLARSPRDAATLRAIGQLHLLCDDFQRAHEALGRAREQALAAGDPVELARVIAAVAETCLLDGRHADAIAECEIGLLATTDAGGDRAAEPAPSRLEIRNTLGKVHLAEGRYEIAERLFGDNLDESRRLLLSFEEARALINQGIARLRLGDDAGAAESYQCALKVADAAGDHRHRAFCLQNLGVLAHWRCDYGAATRYFQEAIGAFKKIGQRGRIAWVALDLASLYLDVGATARAAQMAQLAERMAESRVAAQVRLKRAVIAGRIARAAGDVDAAREHFAMARAAGSTTNPEIAIEAALQLGWLALESGDPQAASDGVAALLASASPVLSPGTRARVRLLLGEVELAGEQPVAARRALLEAGETFHRLGDLDGEWRAHFALARAASHSDDHAEALRRLSRAALVESRLCDRVPEELREALANDPLRRALARAITEAEPARAPGSAGSVKVGVGAPAIAPARVDAGPDRFQRIIGRHPRMRQIFALVEKVARHQSVVLIRGESGTGKELIADAIHARSPRAAHPIIKVNCGALVESLLLSELFGHERGAFTGAVQRQKGRFEAAQHGTIFLDEIGDISPRTQTALLRVIQEREFERVGSTTPIKVDVRILCATNRDLESMVTRGEFREDLYYRLKGIQIDLPPLRERDSDIPILVNDLLRRITEERCGEPKTIAPEAMAALARHPWPGNIRELENVIRSVSLLSDGAVIGPRDLADYPGFDAAARATENAAAEGGAATAWARLGAEGIGLRELQSRIEIECITRALTQSRGNITRAAELLKMKRPRLSQLIKEHGIVL